MRSRSKKKSTTPNWRVFQSLLFSGNFSRTGAAAVVAAVLCFFFISLFVFVFLLLVLFVL